MTDQGAVTREQFDAEMDRLLGNLRPDSPRSRYLEYVDEVRRRYGHKPHDVIRKAVTLIVTQAPKDLPYANDEFWGMFVREAERQLQVSARVSAGLLPLDETRQEREQRENYAAIYDRVGPGTEPFEWGLCAGIAKQRKRRRLLEANTDLDTTAAFRSPQEKADFGAGLDEPTEAEVRDVYDERRAAGVPIGRNPGATSEYWSKHGGGWKSVGDTIRSRGWDKDPAKFVRDVGGFKSTRELLEERRAAGRLEPRMEEYLLEKIKDEEAGA